GVLQSSRYVQGDVATAREAARADAEALRAAGLRVLREKVEADATDEGVPRTAHDARRSPSDRYFEFHVLIAGKSRPLSEGDMRALRAIASEFSTRLGTPVPLSYNALKPSQRFLNLRARRGARRSARARARGRARSGGARGPRGKEGDLGVHLLR